MKVYVDGEPQQTDVKADVLKNTINTGVPFRLERHASDKIERRRQRRPGPSPDAQAAEVADRAGGAGCPR